MTEPFAAYLPHIRQRWLDEQAAWETRRRQAWRAARRAAAILYEQFAADQVIVFGSLTRTGLFDERSDIDLAVVGVAPERFFQACAMMTAVSDTFPIDLIDLADCSPNLQDVIQQEGTRL
ncbi:MAG: nucleotidyltransferase domain-containing protein [Chloroflexi bacterium]|nr:nucleotidyltransferase domain-containing protein [Chloroflexota bacterium]